VASPPDWQRLRHLDGLAVLGPYAAGGPHYTLPDALELARDHAGSPGLRLELVRGVDPNFPPDPYGVLELSLALSQRIGEALTLLRVDDPLATVARAPVASAWLSLRLQGDDPERPEHMSAALRWTGLDGAVWVLRMSAHWAGLVHGCLAGDVVPLDASAVLEIEAIAPRIPLRARGVPRAVAERLLTLADAGRVARPLLVEYFAGAAAGLPLEFQGPIDDVPERERGERLADLVRTHFASLAPPSTEGEPLLELRPPEALTSAETEWDLSRPERTARPLVLRFNPLGEAHAWIEEHGEAELVAKTEVPALDTGIVSIALDASLPPNRRGVLETGVTVSVPAKPPHRVQRLVRTATLSPPGDRAEIRLRLAPGEPLEFGYTAYAVVRDASGIESLEEPERAWSGPRLSLSTADFPLRFLPVAASAALLGLADVSATITRRRDGQEIAESFPLTAEQPALAIAVPREEEEPWLGVEARERSGDRVERLDGVSQGLVDLHSFRGYGPHRVDIECAFEDREGEMLAIELAPEGRTDDPAAIGVVHLTPAESRKTWTWFSDSPFGGGFRWRPYAGPGTTPHGWSGVLDGADPLVLQTGATV